MPSTFTILGGFDPGIPMDPLGLGNSPSLGTIQAMDMEIFDALPAELRHEVTQLKIGISVWIPYKLFYLDLLPAATVAQILPKIVDHWISEHPFEDDDFSTKQRAARC